MTLANRLPMRKHRDKGTAPQPDPVTADNHTATRMRRSGKGRD